MAWLLEVTTAPAELVAVVDEQLDWEPPTLDDAPPSKPLGPKKRFTFDCPLGPVAEACTGPVGIWLVVAPELEEQLPELPVTLVGVCCYAYSKSCYNYTPLSYLVC